MRKIEIYLLSLFLFLSLSCALYGQNGAKKDIFETGKSLTSCDCNLENLFANFGPRFITNHDSIKLISWSFAETLSDTSRISYYAPRIYTPELASFGTSMGNWGRMDSTGRMQSGREFFIRQNPIKIPQGMEDEYQLYIREIQDMAVKSFQIGDRVYEIKFKFVDTEYATYVTCRPGENKIIWGGALFGDIYDLSLP